MATYKTNISKTKQAEKNTGGTQGIFKVMCMKRMAGKPCKYCDQVAELYQGSEEEKILAGKTRAKSSFFFNVIPLKGENKGKNLIAEWGIGIWRSLMNSLPDDESDEDGVDFTDPDESYPVIINREGVGLKTEYTVTIGRKALKVPEKSLKKMFNLSELVEMIEADDVPLVPKLVEGDNKFLVLPPWGEDADGVFFKEVLFHWNLNLLEAPPDGDESELGEDPGSDGDMFSEDGEPEVKKKKKKKQKKAQSNDDDDANDGMGDDVPW